MTTYTFEVDATRNVSAARSFEAYAHEYLGAGNLSDTDTVDWAATEAAYEASIAREYERLASFPEDSVTVELYYSWPYALEGDEYSDDLMQYAMEKAAQSDFWVLS